MQWKAPAANRMLSVMTKRRMSTFFLIVPIKVLQAAEAFVTTEKGRQQEKRKVFTRRVTLLISRLLWGSSYWMKSSIGRCRNWANLTQKRRAGYSRLLIFGNLAAPFLRIVATGMSLCFITARPRSMLAEGSGAR